MRANVFLRSRVAWAMALLFAAAGSAGAQGEATIRGRVVASADGSAVGGALVTLAPAGHPGASEAVSDGSGRFDFPLVAPGIYTLATRADGFMGREVAFVIEPRELRTMTVQLDLARLEAAVEVRGAEPGASGIHSPGSTMLTSARVAALPAGQQHALPDAIAAAAPGMVRGHDDFVHVRGHEVALNPMVNGVSFWENPHALFSAGMSPGVIDSVNVMTGGFPAEYGNRFGGVLDVVTKSGLGMRNDGALSLGGGESGRRSVTGEFGSHRGRFGYYVFGSLFRSDRFISPPDSAAFHDTGRAAHVFAQLDAGFGNAGSLRAMAMGDGANFEIPIHPRDIGLRPGAGGSQRTRQQTAVIGWTRAWSSTLAAVSLYQRWSTARLSPASDPLAALASHDRELATIGAKGDVTRFRSGHAIKVGVDVVRLRPEENLSYDYSGYRELTHLLGWPHIHLVSPTIHFEGATTGGQVSAYVQDTMQLTPRVTANLGLRVDRYDLVVTATQASPRVNLALQGPRGSVLHASYNRFFVPPPIEGLLSSSAGLTAQIREIGVPLGAVEPTTEHQFELGGSAPAGPARLALTSYYRLTDNPVHTTVWPDSRIYSYASFDAARAYGLEAKAELPALARFGIGAYVNYALGRVRFRNPVTGGFITEAAHVVETDRFLAPMDQTHTLTAGATYRHARTGAWLSALVEYGSGTPMGHGEAGHDHAEGEADHTDAAASGGAARVAAHTLSSVSLGLDLLGGRRGRKRLTVQLDAENIANRSHLLAQEGEFSPAQYSIPRIVSATVRVRF